MGGVKKEEVIISVGVIVEVLVVVPVVVQPEGLPPVGMV
jgi:hypothetical protein